MSNLEHRLVRLVVTAAAALSFLIAPTVLLVQSAAEAQAAPRCYPGFIPGNPYAPSCNVGPRTPRVRGGPPDQAAVIACRDIPGCLSWYINNPH